MVEENLVEVKNFPGRLLAEQARDILEKEGIESLLRGEDVGMFGPEVPFSPQGVSLLVLEKDYEYAKELMESLFDGI